MRRGRKKDKEWEMEKKENRVHVGREEQTHERREETRWLLRGSMHYFGEEVGCRLRFRKKERKDELDQEKK